MNKNIFVSPTWWHWTQRTRYVEMYRADRKYLYFPDSRANPSSNQNVEHEISHQNDQEQLIDFLFRSFINEIRTQTRFEDGNLILRSLSSAYLMPDFFPQPRTLLLLCLITQHSPSLRFSLCCLRILPSSIPNATFHFCFLCSLPSHNSALPTLSPTYCHLPFTLLNIIPTFKFYSDVFNSL